MATTQTTRAAKAPKAATKAPSTQPATPVAPTLTVAPATGVPAATPAMQAAALANPLAYTYALGTAAQAIANHATLQRGCTAPVGKQWRANGHKAPNTRHVVVGTLQALGSQFTYSQAVTVLQPLKTAAILGSGTPASYIRAFIKCGYLVPMSKVA